MPRTTIDYSKTIIYKLVHKEDYDNANIYVGSTTDFVKRKCNHKTCCNNEKNRDHNEKKYQYIRENGGWDCFNMIEIEKYPCNDGNEARAREEYWRCHFNANLNSQKSIRTKEELIIYQKEYDKIYYENNKEKIAKYQKEYNKKYKEEVKEKQKVYNKIYYENNKEKILEYQKEHKINKALNL
jgi:hypothetical protein